MASISYSGKQSGLNIKAEEAIMNFNFTQGAPDPASRDWRLFLFRQAR